MSTLWEDNNVWAKQYRCGLSIYLMNVLSSLYGIILDREINSPGHEKNVVGGLNVTDKRYLKEQMELLGKLASKNTSKIGMLPSA